MFSKYHRVFYLLLLTVTGFIVLLVQPVAAQSPQSADSSQSNTQTYHEAYFLSDHLNQGLGVPDSATGINLQTPQAALEHFMLSSREENFSSAAHALNLNLIADNLQSTVAPLLAQQFFYVLNQRLWIDWDEIPDRADGQLDIGNNSDPLVGTPRRSLRIGMIDLDGRDIAIRLQRVKTPEADPVWVFSPNTVENIQPLYQTYGPGLIEKQLPAWARERSMLNVPLWEWFALLLLFIISGLVAWMLQKIMPHLIRRAEIPFVQSIARAIATPLAIISGILLFYILTLTVLPLTGPAAKILYPLLTLLIVAMVTWLGMRLIGFFADYFKDQYVNDMSSYENENIRHTLTYITIARRVLVFAALLAGIGIALSQLNMLRSLGISLLASAGVASVIVGVAAHSVLGNIMAGIQIAITRPASIGDNVYFEGQWGYVEEITYTYIVIRTWDKRRVIVPIKYFLEHPFENWSSKNSNLIKPIYLYVDYRTDVQKLRDKFEELLQNDDDWDEENPPTVQVTDAKEETMEVRALCSAKDPSVAWDLHCRLREQLIRYIQDIDDGDYLPTQRLILQKQSAENSN